MEWREGERFRDRVEGERGTEIEWRKGERGEEKVGRGRERYRDRGGRESV